MAEEFEKQYSVIKVDKDLNQSINSFFKKLLTKTDLKGIIVPQQLPSSRGFTPALLTAPEALESANAIAPFMPVNTAKAVSDYTRLKPSQDLVAVVLRPCEERALVELVKLKQVNMDNIIIIGVDCPGTYPIQNLSDIDDNEPLDTDSLMNKLENLEDILEHRIACRACEYSSPSVADIIIGLYGIKLSKEFLISINSNNAKTLVEPMKLTYNSGAIERAQAREKAIDRLNEKRLKFTEKLESTTQERIHGLDNFMSELSACINCHNCMTVCPVCYCKECFFESPTFDLESDKYLKLAEHKGSLRLPANMFLFHVTRFNHMVLSCVACGMCEQGCPVGIPLLSIYKTVGRNAQKVFDYVPGRSLEEDIPILTFQEEELEPR